MNSTLVVDASVIVKWLLADREQDTAAAQALMARVADGEVSVRQPAHWLAEVAAVLARLSPSTASEDIALLAAMELAVEDAATVMQLACTLAIELDHHLFDTLYHAVALDVEGAILVTADNRYLRKAKQVGRVCALNEWRHRR